MPDSQQRIQRRKNSDLKCKICGNSGEIPERNYRVRCIFCQKCDVLWTTEKLPEKQLIEIYKKDFHRGRTFITNLKKRLFLREIQAYKKNGKLFDVGCSQGFFLEYAKKRGWDVSGNEISEEALELLEKKGLKVWKTVLKEIKDPKKYDVFTLWHIFEHFGNPEAELKAIRKKIVDDGYVFIACPNYNSFKRKVLNEDWGLLISTGHLFCHSEKSVKELLKMTGFQPVKIGSYEPFFSKDFLKVNKETKESTLLLKQILLWTHTLLWPIIRIFFPLSGGSLFVIAKAS